MANPVNLNDPFNSLVSDPSLNHPTRFEDNIQADPEPVEDRAGGGRVAMFAVAIAVVFGALFYFINSGAMNPANGTRTATAPITQPRPPASTRNIADSKPQVAPGVRDVTPGNNEAGTTTGAAPSRPQAAPGDAVDRANKGDAK